MTNMSLGDLALSFQNRLANVRLKSDLQRLGTELGTGRTADLRAATRGDMSALASIERAMTTLDGHRVAANEAAVFLAGAQRALETAQDTGADLAPVLLQAENSGHATMIDAAAADAKARFETVVAALNTQVAGRSLFGGTATGGPALASSDAMLAELTAAIAGETTAVGVEAAVDAWFDTAGGGFETSGYLGSVRPLDGFRIGPGESASMTVTAADQEIRDLLKGYAMAALVADGALAGAFAERGALVGISGERLLAANGALTEIRAAIGSSEARIDAALGRNAAEASALELARNEIVAVDPYKTATDLQAVQAQLETHYTLTARLSRLSLTDYLR